MKPGDPVWYEPSDGIRFAGVITGAGSIPGTYGVMLCHHYTRWRGRNASGADFWPAVSSLSLTRRSESRHIDLQYVKARGQ